MLTCLQEKMQAFFYWSCVGFRGAEELSNAGADKIVYASEELLVKLSKSVKVKVYTLI